MSKPFIPWIGGKRRLANKIIPMFPDHTCYVEPFAGAAALFFIKDPSKVEVLNDINGELVNLYRVIKYHLEEFVKQFKYALVSRQVFEWEKLKHPETLTDIQRAARFFYLQKLAFGGRVKEHRFGSVTTGKPRFNLLRIEEDLSEAHQRLANTQIENLSWQKCLERYDRAHTFAYIDPPYYKTEGYGVEFGIDQYEELSDLARAMKGKSIISVNDIPEMRKIFKGLKTKTVDITYTVGGAAKKTRPKKELIIKNW